MSKELFRNEHERKRNKLKNIAADAELYSGLSLICALFFISTFPSADKGEQGITSLEELFELPFFVKLALGSGIIFIVATILNLGFLHAKEKNDR